MEKIYTLIMSRHGNDVPPLIPSFAMSRQFYSVSARNWFTLDWVQLQFSGQTASFIGRWGIYAPAEYSFHCGSVSSFPYALLVPNKTNQNTSQWILNFADFQVRIMWRAMCSRWQLACLLECMLFEMGVFWVLFSLVNCTFSAFCVADSGLRVVKWKFLLCQRLCRILLNRDLDGAADLTAHAADPRLRPAHDHAA